MLLPPLLAFVVARAVLWWASASVGLGWPNASDLARRDSLLYLSIADHGYTLFPCDRVGGWCGNAGWLPAYPSLISVPLHLGISGAAAGAVLSGGLQLAALMLLWSRLIARATNTLASILALLATAVFPGVVYDAAVFPMSLLAALVLAAFAVERTRPRLAAVSGVVAAATHPLGIALSIGLAVSAVALRASRNLRRASLHLAAGVAGLVAVAITQWIWVGHPDAYILVQRHYGHGGASPLTTFQSAKESTLSFLHDPHRLDLVPQVQLVVVALFVLSVLTATIVGWRSVTHGELGLAVFTACAWATPLLLGGVSLYRSDVALLPALALAPRLPRTLVAAFIVVAALLAFEMSRLFFTGALA